MLQQFERLFVGDNIDTILRDHRDVYFVAGVDVTLASHSEAVLYLKSSKFQRFEAYPRDSVGNS